MTHQDEVLAQQNRDIRKQLEVILANPVPIAQMVIAVIRQDGSVENPLSVVVGHEHSMVGLLELQKTRVFEVARNAFMAAQQQMKEQMCRAPQLCTHPACECLNVVRN